MIRGRRAHGAALATLATCAHLSPDNQARLHRAGSVPCNQDPKTLKMSAYGTLSPTARPPRVLHRGRCRTRVRHVAGCRENLLHPYPNVGSPPTCKGQAASGCFASLDRFPAPSASDRFATLTEVERGQGRRSRAFLPLTPWSRPNTSPQGQVVGF